jgi:disulfide bond formation protein DsbB
MRRPYLAFACFLAGLLLILVVELPIARIVGVPLMFAGIALGVAVIASPDFLERDHGSGLGEE